MIHYTAFTWMYYIPAAWSSFFLRTSHHSFWKCRKCLTPSRDCYVHKWTTCTACAPNRRSWNVQSSLAFPPPFQLMSRKYLRGLEISWAFLNYSPSSMAINTNSLRKHLGNHILGLKYHTEKNYLYLYKMNNVLLEKVGRKEGKMVQQDF